MFSLGLLIFAFFLRSMDGLEDPRTTTRPGLQESWSLESTVAHPEKSEASVPPLDSETGLWGDQVHTLNHSQVFTHPVVGRW